MLLHCHQLHIQNNDTTACSVKLKMMVIFHYEKDIITYELPFFFNFIYPEMTSTISFLDTTSSIRSLEYISIYTFHILVASILSMMPVQIFPQTWQPNTDHSFLQYNHRPHVQAVRPFFQ
jgi:hypothetical protein